jgi:hypothetical protein
MRVTSGKSLKLQSFTYKTRQYAEYVVLLPRTGKKTEEA